MPPALERVFQVADNSRWTDAENMACIPDARTIHSHIDYALVNSWLVGVIDKLNLEALSAISTEVALYT